MQKHIERNRSSKSRNPDHAETHREKSVIEEQKSQSCRNTKKRFGHISRKLKISQKHPEPTKPKQNQTVIQTQIVIQTQTEPNSNPNPNSNPTPTTTPNNINTSYGASTEFC